MRVSPRTMKLVVEPTGCLGLAAVLAAGDLAGLRVGRARERRQRRPGSLRDAARAYN
jgi:hypothetical protein